MVQLSWKKLKQWKKKQKRLRVQDSVCVCVLQAWVSSRNRWRWWATAVAATQEFFAYQKSGMFGEYRNVWSCLLLNSAHFGLVFCVVLHWTALCLHTFTQRKQESNSLPGCSWIYVLKDAESWILFTLDCVYAVRRILTYVKYTKNIMWISLCLTLSLSRSHKHPMIVSIINGENKLFHYSKSTHFVWYFSSASAVRFDMFSSVGGVRYCYFPFCCCCVAFVFEREISNRAEQNMKILWD